MGLKKKLHKQKKRIRQKFEKAAEKASGFLDELASKTSNSDSGVPTTITTPQKQNSTSSFFSKLDSLAVSFQHKLEEAQKYDYEIDNTTDEATGETTTKLVTRDKATGKIVSSHTRVHLPDGTIRVSNCGGAPFAGFASEQKVPSEIPTDGSQIEYTFREIKDGEPTIVECEVKDGPEAGKKMQYKVKTDEKGETEYELVVLSNPSRFKSHWVNFVLFCILMLTMAFLENNTYLLLNLKSRTMNSICMPIAPFSQLSAADDMEVRFEAPWWAPGSRKSEVFSKICSGSRTAIEWKSKKAKGILSVHAVSDTGKSTRKQKHSGLASASFFPSEMGISFPTGRKQVVNQVHWGS